MIVAQGFANFASFAFASAFGWRQGWNVKADKTRTILIERMDGSISLLVEFRSRPSLSFIVEHRLHVFHHNPTSLHYPILNLSTFSLTSLNRPSAYVELSIFLFVLCLCSSSSVTFAAIFLTFISSTTPQPQCYHTPQSLADTTIQLLLIRSNTAAVSFSLAHTVNPLNRSVSASSFRLFLVLA